MKSVPHRRRGALPHLVVTTFYNRRLWQRAAHHGVVGGLALAIAMPIGTAHAAGRKNKPTQIGPQKKNGKERRQARRNADDLSEGGARNGALELTLGSVVLATSGYLVGRGAWEIVQSRKFAEDCEAGRSDAVGCNILNPRRQGSIAAGLSFGFAAVIGVAGGLLLARGVRIHRDYRQHRRSLEDTPVEARVRVAPWASLRSRSAGVSLHLRF